MLLVNKEFQCKCGKNCFVHRNRHLRETHVLSCVFCYRQYHNNYNNKKYKFSESFESWILENISS